ncbi:MAG: DUF928 domain-containing protein [Leptolyngbya sp. RL_3_1]|nr:DUF928 domain-containing protein [Leptolyngbya sp. RL_3_1]
MLNKTLTQSSLLLGVLALGIVAGSPGMAALNLQPNLSNLGEGLQVASRFRLRLGSRPSRYRLGAFRRGASCLPEGAELTALIPPVTSTEPDADIQDADIQAEAELASEEIAVDESALADAPLNQPENEVDPELTVPVDATTVEHPAFFVYIPALDGPTTAQFTLQSDPNDPLAVEELVNVRFTVSGEEGIVGIWLPETTPPLQTDRQYYWQMSVECNAEKLTENPVISGWVQRVGLDQPLPETAAQQAAFYAEQGIWQDALSTLATLRYGNPDNAAFITDWQALMEAAGLEGFADQPIVQMVELE